MSLWWRHHIKHAEQLLEMAKADGTSTARRLALLYELIVSITSSICDLEAHRDEEAKTGKP